MWRKLVEFVSFKLVSPFNWGRIKFLLTGREFNLLPQDREYARRLMQIQPYLWVSRRRTHLTSYLIGFSDWSLQLFTWLRAGFQGPRPKWGYWTHAFINDIDCDVIEAVSKGVIESYFDDVFDCDSVACLKPANIPDVAWKVISMRVLQKAKDKKGAKYDTFFDLANDDTVSCIELVRVALKEIPKYEELFADFENAIKLYSNLTPQMLYDSKSFVVVWEVRR